MPGKERKDEYPMSNTLKGIFDKEFPTDEGEKCRAKQAAWFHQHYDNLWMR